MLCYLYTCSMLTGKTTWTFSLSCAVVLFVQPAFNVNTSRNPILIQLKLANSRPISWHYLNSLDFEGHIPHNLLKLFTDGVNVPTTLVQKIMLVVSNLGPFGLLSRHLVYHHANVVQWSVINYWYSNYTVFISPHNNFFRYFQNNVGVNFFSYLLKLIV